MCIQMDVDVRSHSVPDFTVVGNTPVCACMCMCMRACVHACVCACVCAACAVLIQ